MLQEKIKEYIEKNSVRELQKKVWVGANVIYAILNSENRKYFKESLDKLYKFFDLAEDLFFKKNIILPKRKNPLWKLLYLKRLKLGLSENEVAKKLKCSLRQLKRIELGDLKNYDSYFVKEILKLYNFSEVEKEKIWKYCKSLKDLQKIEV